MPALNEYHILISHSWDYSNDYKIIEGWLNQTPYFKWTNYSVPLSKQLDISSKRELKEKLENRIAVCSCVIVLSGMYVSYSEWIDFEIETAVKYNKPIIAIKPWGQQRIPDIVSRCADEIVGWNSSSVIDAIRNHGLIN